MKLIVICYLLGLFAYYSGGNGSDSGNDNGSQDNGWKLGHYKQYLRDNGYLGHAENKDNPTSAELKLAITKLRILYHFDSSVNMSRIYEFLEKPRCGVPDLRGSSKRKRRYNIYAAWPKKDFTYVFLNLNSGLSVDEQKSIVADAFSAWKSAAPSLMFTETTSTTADIKFSFVTGTHEGCSSPFDGQGSTLAHAYFPQDGRVHFDNDEPFTATTTVDGINLYAVALHEIGHALGLDHSFKETSVMYAVYEKSNPITQLDVDDVNGIQALYESEGDQTGSCVDDDASLCISYQNAGYCQDYPDVMMEVCRFTCGLC